jgi:hypothetical protein
MQTATGFQQPSLQACNRCVQPNWGLNQTNRFDASWPYQENACGRQPIESSIIATGLCKLAL